MKALLLLFLVYVVWSDAQWAPKKPYPKKVQPDIHRGLHIKRYIKDTDKVNNMKKQIENTRDYTLFPLPGSPMDDPPISIPDSPLFPLGETLRVKKELMNPWRKKRSIDDDDSNAPNVQRRKRSVKNRKGGKGRKTVNKKKKRAAGKRKGQKSKQRQAKGKKRQAKVQRKVEGRRLIAAEDAIIEDYPYTVSIQKGQEHWCSGALLNRRLVITTANCVWKGKRMSRLKVRAGSRNSDRGGQVAKIQEMRKHPKWDIRSYPDNDVALLLLDRNIRFSHAVHAVDLPNRIMLPPFNDVWVTSYGSNRRDGLYPDKDMTLQVYHANLMDRDKCNNVTQRFGITVTENFICLAQTGKRAPCTRDTGAPAVSDGVLWALASWGIRKLCGTLRYPAVYSYLGSHSNLEFIQNATKDLMSDQVNYLFLDRLQTKAADNRRKPTTIQYYTGQH